MPTANSLVLHSQPTKNSPNPTIVVTAEAVVDAVALEVAATQDVDKTPAEAPVAERAVALSGMKTISPLLLDPIVRICA